MHVNNATDFLRSTQHHLVAGDTLVFDFIFFLHPVSAAPAWCGARLVCGWCASATAPACRVAGQCPAF